MGFFRKAKRPPPNPFKEKVAKGIAHRLVALQLSAAKKLHRWQTAVPVKSRNRMLAILGIVWLLYCLYILISAIIG